MDGIEKVEVHDDNSALTAALLAGANNNHGNDVATMLAATGGGMNNMWNSPMSLFALPLMYGMIGGNGWGWGGNGNNANAEVLSTLQNQISSLSNQVSADHNNGITNGNIDKVSNALGDLAIGMNAGFSGVNNGMCGIKTAIVEQGYQNQLGNCQQTNTILMGNQGLQNAVQNGFTMAGFQLERNACDVKETSTANTQKIIDTMNNHWNLEQQTTIQQLRDEVSRLEQTQTILAALSAGTATTKAVTATT